MNRASNSSAQYLARRLMTDAHFLYTAFAPLCRNSRAADRPEADAAPDVLVKVGISVAPMDRLVAVHCGSPFRVAYAAFAPTYSAKRQAEKIEKRLLVKFRDYRTRGEWLMLPNTSEMRRQFSQTARAILQDETGRPVEWTRVTATMIAVHAGITD